jgi:hypothetical protein
MLEAFCQRSYISAVSAAVFNENTASHQGGTASIRKSAAPENFDSLRGQDVLGSPTTGRKGRDYSV